MRRLLLAALAAFALLLCTGGYLPCDYYDERTFAVHVAAARAYEPGGTLRAGVVPHHLLAGRMTASFFAAAAQDPPDTVLIVAPSHYPTGAGVVTSLSGWQTPFGPVENDAALTRRLLQSGAGAREDDANMRLDHAVSGLTPYVRYYLPGAKLAAALLENGLDSARTDAVASWAAVEAAREDEKVLLVCSIDFSHYLSPAEAALRDAQTREAVASFDYEAIGRYGDGNLDSPQAMTVFLRCAQSLGIGDVTFFDHGSAERVLGLAPADPAYCDGVTTYFILGAVEQTKEETTWKD